MVQKGGMEQIATFLQNPSLTSYKLKKKDEIISSLSENFLYLLTVNKQKDEKWKNRTGERRRVFKMLMREGRKIGIKEQIMCTSFKSAKGAVHNGL